MQKFNNPHVRLMLVNYVQRLIGDTQFYTVEDDLQRYLQFAMPLLDELIIPE